jgi:tetratricopeptide (TPR) repeat protein
LPEQALSRVISAPEMEELQCDVLQSILALALSQAVSNPTEACTHVKTAAGLVELLPPESKLIFARNALGVVLTASTSEVIADEIVGPLRLISRSLDSIRHPSTDIEEEIVKLKLANLITLMRIYHESNLCDKGILALEQAEALFSTIKGQEFKSFDIKDSQVQFIWNKYLLLSKKGDIAESEKALRKIIMTIDEHDLILKAMRIAVNSGINDDIVGALYNSVLESFPNDSEFSKTRLAMLRAVVLRSTETSPQKEGGSASKETQDNSLKLANLMTGDHASGARILAPDTLASLRSLLEERIKYNHAMGYFSSALAWVGLLEELSITTDDRSGSRVAFLLRYKAELLSALGQIPAAYAAAESLIIIEQSTKSFVIFFRIAIDHLGAATAATHLPIWLHDGGTGVCETLFRIDMCMRVVEERGLEDALIVLQRQWMEYYCSQKAWTCSEEDPDGSSPRITTFATILCCHAELFNRLHVRKVNNDGRLSEEEKLPSPKKRRLMKASRTEQEVIMEDAVGALLNLNNSDRVIEEDIPYLSEEPRLEYLLAASLSDLHAKVLEPAGLLLKAADSMEEQHIKQLGNPDDFKWYANFIWNVGLMTVHQVGEVENLKPRMKLTSECAEMSSHVLRKLVHNSIQHVDCLVVAAAYRLDADSMLPQTKDLDSQENLRQALHDIEQARHSLKTWPDDDAKEFLNLTLIMRFTVLLRSGDKSAETYIDRHRNQLLDLSVKQLQHIAVICNQEANGSAFQGLEFLQLALQVCKYINLRHLRVNKNAP